MTEAVPWLANLWSKPIAGLCGDPKELAGVKSEIGQSAINS